MTWKRDQKVTGKEACEYIAQWLEETRGGPRIDPERFWNACATGELTHVFDAYLKARCDTACDRPGCGGRHVIRNLETPAGAYELDCAPAVTVTAP